MHGETVKFKKDVIVFNCPPPLKCKKLARLERKGLYDLSLTCNF